MIRFRPSHIDSAPFAQGYVGKQSYSVTQFTPKPTGIDRGEIRQAFGCRFGGSDGFDT